MLIFGDRNISYPERLKRLKLFSMEHRRRRGNMIEMYKLCDDDSDEYWTRL
jgi:hypothetical protein